MPRLIFKCPYMKGGSKTSSHRANYVRYSATRDGVEQISRQESYVEYIAQRPRAERRGSHGLFSAEDTPPVLSHVVKEVAAHEGNVWTPIISLRREDAARLGYDKAASWQKLLTRLAPELAEQMKIPLEHFKWYAAFHDEGYHPHVHMICYSTDPKEGYISKKGIEIIKSVLAREIFHNELLEIYEKQTQYRNQLGEATKERMEQLIHEMKNGSIPNERIVELMINLSNRLKNISGKKQYGYLEAPLKDIVDEIVSELEKDPRVKEAYDLWYKMREEVLHTYRDDVPQRVPLCEQKEFKRIKNIVIEEAVKLGETESTQIHVAQSVTRLLKQLSNIFQDKTPNLNQDGPKFTDRKLLQKMREKKAALGEKGIQQKY